MKALETQYAELKEKAVASGKITEAQIKEKLADYGTKRHAFAGPVLLEEQLSVLKKIVAEVGITESVELRESRPRIERKNGRAIQESGDNVFTAEEKRIEKYMLGGKSYQEAFCIATGATTKATKEPAKFTEARKARLTEFYSGVISEQDITAMAERGIEP
jgi:hypothetical protein